jgi:hypothetical protein
VVARDRKTSTPSGSSLVGRVPPPAVKLAAEKGQPPSVLRPDPGGGQEGQDE